MWWWNIYTWFLFRTYRYLYILLGLLPDRRRSRFNPDHCNVLVLCQHAQEGQTLRWRVADPRMSSSCRNILYKVQWNIELSWNHTWRKWYCYRAWNPFNIESTVSGLWHWHVEAVVIRMQSHVLLNARCLAETDEHASKPQLTRV